MVANVLPTVHDRVAPLFAETTELVHCDNCSLVREFGGTIRLLEYVRPRGAMRSAITRLWEPWVAWAYGAGFDRRTEERVPEAGLEVVESRRPLPLATSVVKQVRSRIPRVLHLWSVTGQSGEHNTIFHR